MEKVLRIVLILSVLSLAGCDFLRKVAGRPTEAELEVKKYHIAARERAVDDSILRVREEALRKKAVEDSLARLASADSAAFSRYPAGTCAGTKLSSVFSFGAPQTPLQKKYNVIIGVYRNEKIADAQMNDAQARGFSPFKIPFKGGVNAVCLASSDSFSELESLVIRGKRSGICPNGTWVYVRNQ